MVTSGASRAGWGVVDQAVSTLTNFVGMALIARQVTPEEFGSVTLAFVASTVALATVKGVWGESLLILGGQEPSRREDLSRTALTGGLGQGVALASVVALAGLLVGGISGEVLVVTALVIPAMLLHEVARYSLFGRGRPDLATVTDLAWLVATIVAITLIGRAGGGPVALVVGWLVGVVPAAVLGVAMHSWSMGSLATVRRWLVDRWRTYLPLAGDVAGGPGSRALALLAVLAVAGLVEGGGFRAAQLVMGPITVLTMAAPPIFLAQFAGRSRRSLVAATRRTMVVLGLLATSWVVVVAIIPREVGVVILGDVWDEARPLVLAVGAYHVASAISLTPFLALRSGGRTKPAFRLRLYSGVSLVLAAALGALAAGAVGAASAMICVELGTLVAGTRMTRSYMANTATEGDQ